MADGKESLDGKQNAAIRVPSSLQALCLIIAITLLAFGLRVFRLDEQSLWWDEVFIVFVGRMPFPEWLQYVFVEERSHPPGFFAFMSLWTEMGVNAFWVRYASVIWGTLSVPLSYALARRVAGFWVGLLGALLLAVSPFHIWYSQEARMYAPQVILALLSGYLFLRLLRAPSRRDMFALAAVHTVGFYVYYLFLFVFLAQMVFLITRRRRYRAAMNHWFAANAIAGVLFAPWLAAILMSGGFATTQLLWVLPAQWYDPILTLYTLLVGSTTRPWDLVYWLSPVFFGVMALYGMQAARAGEPRDSINYLAIWLLLSIGVLFLVSLPVPSFQKRSIYVDRYLIGELPALLILAAFGLDKLGEIRKRLAALGLVIALVPMALSLSNMYFNYPFFRDDWRGVSAYLDERAEPAGDAVVMEASLTWPFSYYDESKLRRIPFYPNESLFAQAMDEGLSRQPVTRLWLFTATIPGNAHRFVPTPDEQLLIGQRDPWKRVLDSRFVVEAEKLFQGVLVTEYRISR